MILLAVVLAALAILAASAGIILDRIAAVVLGMVFAVAGLAAAVLYLVA